MDNNEQQLINEEPDLVVFQDENDNEITMEVLNYFFYEGEEYAELTEYVEDKCEGCNAESCDNCGPIEITIMKVVPVGDDEEEFIPVEEELARKLVDLLESGAFDDDDAEDEE